MSTRVFESSITSENLITPRKAWVRHAGDGSAEDCLVWLDGELYMDRVKVPEVIAAAQAAGVFPPLTCIYLPNVSAADRHAIYTCDEQFADFIGQDMPRWIEREVGEFKQLFLCGLSLSALQSIFTALRYPGIFAGVLAQSPSAWWEDEHLAATLTSTGTQETRFWLSVGSQELQENLSHSPTPLYQKTCQLDSVRRLARAMALAGNEVHFHEYEGGHDPVCWREELTRALDWLLLAPGT